MKIRIFSLAKNKHEFIRSGEAEYISRIKHFAQVELIELDAQKYANAAHTERIEREAALLLEAIKGSKPIIVLDEGGKNLGSEQFSGRIAQWMNGGHSTLNFVLGGPLGIADSLKKSADLVLSLSPLTFTAQFARLILCEQIYRAFTIIRGLPYHKE